jgi:hypothetical protein
MGPCTSHLILNPMLKLQQFEIQIEPWNVLATEHITKEKDVIIVKKIKLHNK